MKIVLSISDQQKKIENSEIILTYARHFSYLEKTFCWSLNLLKCNPVYNTNYELMGTLAILQLLTQTMNLFHHGY